eukprot:m.335449 g.335449  ORF g.335449 m.335449 type:complete len:341 (+) comp55678_c0_seq14:721-1743(+)
MVYITQYDPNTYKADGVRHDTDSFDYRIGRAMFETTWLPSGWVENIQHVNEVWVPSAWAAVVFSEAGVPASKIKVIPEAIDTDVFDATKAGRLKKPSLFPNSTNSFNFLSVFKWEDRKNWQTLLKAFALEFEAQENVALYIRSGTPDSIKNSVETIRKQLRLTHTLKIYGLEKVSVADYPKLFATANAFVLPTHGEGWGRPLMQAMAMGLPTIAPNWSGHTEFMNEENSFLVPVSQMVSAYPQQQQLTGGNAADRSRHQWADIEVDDLRKAMRYVYAHQPIAALTGRTASEQIRKKYSRKAVADLVTDRLREITNGIAHDFVHARSAEHESPELHIELLD